MSRRPQTRDRNRRWTHLRPRWQLDVRNRDGRGEINRSAREQMSGNRIANAAGLGIGKRAARMVRRLIRTARHLGRGMRTPDARGDRSRVHNAERGEHDEMSGPAGKPEHRSILLRVVGGFQPMPSVPCPKAGDDSPRRASLLRPERAARAPEEIRTPPRRADSARSFAALRIRPAGAGTAARRLATPRAPAVLSSHASHAVIDATACHAGWFAPAKRELQVGRAHGRGVYARNRARR